MVPLAGMACNIIAGILMGHRFGWDVGLAVSCAIYACTPYYATARRP